MDRLTWLYPYLDTIKIQSGNELFHHCRIMETSNSLKTLKPPLHITMQSPPSVSTLKQICFLRALDARNLRILCNWAELAENLDFFPIFSYNCDHTA